MPYSYHVFANGLPVTWSLARNYDGNLYQPIKSLEELGLEVTVFAEDACGARHQVEYYFSTNNQLILS